MINSRILQHATIGSLVLTAGVSDARSQVARSDLELRESRVYVDVQVNGQGPYRFMIDTGASGVGRADVRLVSQLGLEVLRQEENSDGVNTSLIDVVRVASLGFGDFVLEDVELYARDYNRRSDPEGVFYGILGLGFFQDGLLTIDYGGRTIVYEEGAGLDGDSPGVFSYRDELVVPVRLGGIDASGHLDTGSTLTMHLPISYLERLDTSQPVEAGTGRRANTTFKLWSARIQEPVVVGGVSIPDVEALFSDQARRINLGGALLSDLILRIDQPNRLIQLSRVPRGSPSP